MPEHCHSLCCKLCKTLMALCLLTTAAALLIVLLASKLSSGSLFPTGFEIYSFGAKGSTDVELFKEVVRSRQSFIKNRSHTVRYPTEGTTTKNIVTYVEVKVPQRILSKDEVRIMGGGPGLNHVVVSIAGRRSNQVEYTVSVYGRDLEHLEGEGGGALVGEHGSSPDRKRREARKGRPPKRLQVTRKVAARYRGKREAKSK